MKILNILILDDDPTQLELLKIMFQQIQYPPINPAFTSTGEDFFSILSLSHFDLVITDFFMPDISGGDILERVKIEKPDCEVIIMTSGTTTKEAISLMRKGAYDFFIKPISQEILVDRLVKIFELKNLIQENRKLLAQAKILNTDFSSDIIYKSRQMEEIVNIAARSSGTNYNILLRGESGTGKELLARAIHSSSTRKNQSFITVNIAALPESLIESELFGHVKGAYTGAETERKGRFEEADKGTIFIDEAGDIPLSIQIKLLRVIQFGEFQKVGSNKTGHTDVRIITATSRNLEEMIREGKFREDLFYRLNVIPIEIPPLRDRKEDISLLIDFFLKRISEKLNKDTAVLTEDANNLLLNYSYPGNIRELENIIEYTLAISRSPFISTRELPSILMSKTKDNFLNSSEKRDYTESMIIFESGLITNALKEVSGNQSAAARFLGISERKLRSRMEILNIENIFR